jgi:hypothetical protein
LTNNSFSGQIPASIGSLSNLYWLDLADNQLEGSIPVSNGATPGLDMLFKAKHLYVNVEFEVNKLTKKHFTNIYIHSNTLVYNTFTLI